MEYNGRNGYTRTHGRSNYVTVRKPRGKLRTEYSETESFSIGKGVRHGWVVCFQPDPKERLPSGHTLPWRAWRTSNRVRSGQAATPAAKHLWGYRDSKNCMCCAATCDLNHIMTSCTHFGERPSLDDIAEMKDGYVRWLRAIADTI